jgi:hypothetical protein
MKKAYLSPEMVDFGSIAALTGIFGSQNVPDVSVNPQGQTIQTGTGSINQCPTLHPAQGGVCHIKGA